MMNTLEDIPRLYTALSEWSACTVYIIILQKRIKDWRLVLVSLFWLVVQGFFLYFTDDVSIVLWVPIMVIAVGLMFAYLFSCCNLTWKDVGFCCAKAFVLAELISALEWQIYSFFVNQGMTQAPWLRNLLCLIVYAVAFSADYWLEARKLPRDKGIGVKSMELANTVIIALTIFAFSNISFINIKTPFSGTNLAEINYIRTLVDLCGVLLLYTQQDGRRRRQLANEMESVNNLLNRQYDQYQMSRHNLEVLDQKYHDLKHQIIAIRQESNQEKKEQYLDEMEERIRMYESEFRTGYHVLDILLNMKNAMCSMKHINFTCMAEGSLLRFMDTVDVCSIFGNALDNAIESVEKQEDVEKRLIRTAVYAKGQLIMIKFENYCEEPPVLENGLPGTTKKNKNFHGYGLKSIDMIAQKYGGSMSINTENNWFVLKVLIPKPSEK